MKAATVLQSLYQSFAKLFASSHLRPWTEPQNQENPKVESASQRQYFVSHIDDYCDCV
ncbi:hypothetical protein [Methylobacillus sp. MM3]|jgi:hypothetical protein|uniref:hypothetical protein n=1 Tax=Methylobacillus sp. MM3 TaxID=1848039 RepID=UPI0013F4CA33|nr:hypothetical protein [Methylobacillus sp. MM3]